MYIKYILCINILKNGLKMDYNQISQNMNHINLLLLIYLFLHNI